MPASRARRGRVWVPRVPEAGRLVGPVCHEVGNLLAAVRLSAHLLGSDLPEGERARTASEVDALTAQAGALLAQLPLLSGRAPRRGRLRAADVLEALEASLAVRPPGAAGLTVGAVRGALAFRADPDSLHHLLVALVLAACEAAGAKGAVTVRASAEGARVRLRIEDDGVPLERAPGPGPGVVLRGRALLVCAGAAVLRAGRGSLRVEPRTRGNRIDLLLPAVRGSR